MTYQQQKSPTRIRSTQQLLEWKFSSFFSVRSFRADRFYRKIIRVERVEMSRTGGNPPSEGLQKRN